MFRKYNESGRTMMETLGVLAIIGLLTVLGIWTYTTAMRQWRANQLKEGVSLYLMELAKNEATGLYDRCASDDCTSSTSWHSVLPERKLIENVAVKTARHVPEQLELAGNVFDVMGLCVQFENSAAGTSICNKFCNSYNSKPNEEQDGKDFGRHNCKNFCELTEENQMVRALVYTSVSYSNNNPSDDDQEDLGFCE